MPRLSTFMGPHLYVQLIKLAGSHQGLVSTVFPHSHREISCVKPVGFPPRLQRLTKIWTNYRIALANNQGVSTTDGFKSINTHSRYKVFQAIRCP